VKSAAHYTEAAEDEVKLLRAIRDTNAEAKGRERVVLLMDDFKHYGPHGAHICMVMEVLGNNLLHLIKAHNYRGISLILVRRILRQVLQGLDYMHTQCKIIHTDIKPENILLTLSKSQMQKIVAMSAEAPNSANKRDQGSGAISSEAGDNSKMSKTQKKNSKRRAKQKAQKAKKASVSSEPDDDEDKRDGNPDGAEDADLNTSVSSAASADAPNAGAAQRAEPLSKPGDGSDTPAADAGAATVDTSTGTGADLVDLLEESLQQAQFLTSNVKIADLGNACWVHRHFTPDIQTRQYRSIEVILGAEYDTSADIWSVACMAFELATGDFLFEPHSGENYSRDEDHCALISELLGQVPVDVAMSGEYSRDVFDKKGNLLHIKELKPWSLDKVLIEKYDRDADEAKAFASFLLRMLALKTSERASAAECLKHPWLQPTEQEEAAIRLLAAA